MRENTKTGTGLHRAVPAVVLAAVTAMPAGAAAAPEPPAARSPEPAAGEQQAAQSPQPAAGEQQAAQVPCARGAGDDALVRAIRAGGRIALQPQCTYVVTKRHGRNSALPPITRDTTIEGRNTVIAWGGRQKVPSLLEIGGQNVRFVLRGVTLRGGEGMSTIRNQPGSSGTVEQYGANQSIGDPKDDKAASMLTSWLAPGLTGRK